ncbi:hypothetical protein, partial [Actinomadura sp. LOL_011]|uniref:hypothetical protein n=1 Tax=Actinomadura sp. LOL_011 TaxID=3345410 RepID=UPI003A7FA433
LEERAVVKSEVVEALIEVVGRERLGTGRRPRRGTYGIDRGHGVRAEDTGGVADPGLVGVGAGGARVDGEVAISVVIGCVDGDLELGGGCEGEGCVEGQLLDVG